MSKDVILLVEDNPDDIFLTKRAFEKSHLLNEIVIARDGVEAIDYLFGTGAYEGRDMSIMPVLILLDLNIPGMGGKGFMRRAGATKKKGENEYEEG